MYQGLSERDLAIFCSRGDRMAEEELYKRYAARVYTLCRRYLGDDDKAKDLMQESFIQALDKIRSFDYAGNGSLYGWLRRITINKAINQIKRQRWRTVSFDLNFHDDIQEPTDDQMETIPKEKLLEWISQLPDVRRTVFNLYCIDGYPHKEIGRMLGISEKGSASALAKARKQLKEEIRHYLNKRDK